MVDATETTLLDSVPDGLFIGGEWAPAISGAHVEGVRPGNRRGDQDHRQRGRRGWCARPWTRRSMRLPPGPKTPPRERGEILRRAFDLVRERQDEVALADDPRDGQATGRVEGRGRSTAASSCAGSPRRRYGSSVATAVNPEGTGRMIVSQHPVGPCFLITPWNFPLAMATRKIAPALAAGCTVVIKPPELTPLTTLYFVKMLGEAGLPPGVVNVITTSTSGKVSAPIIADPRLRKLSFTGSTEVGRKLLQQAAEGILRTSMELGGNAPFLIFDDADLGAAVDGAMLAKFRNIGQACTAANRFIVHEAVADEFAARVTERVQAFKVGRGTEEGVQIGPLINDDAVQKADALVRDATDRGAKVLTGGHAHRWARHVLRADRGRRRTPWQRHPARGDLRTGAEHRDVRRRG